MTRTIRAAKVPQEMVNSPAMRSEDMAGKERCRFQSGNVWVLRAGTVGFLLPNPRKAGSVTTLGSPHLCYQVAKDNCIALMTICTNFETTYIQPLAYETPESSSGGSNNGPKVTCLCSATAPHDGHVSGSAK